MKHKLKLALLLAVVWKIHIYSGDYGHLMYTAKEPPIYMYEGRWLRFIDEDGHEIRVSNGTTIMIKRMEE